MQKSPDPLIATCQSTEVDNVLVTRLGMDNALTTERPPTEQYPYNLNFKHDFSGRNVKNRVSGPLGVVRSVVNNVIKPGPSLRGTQKGSIISAYRAPPRSNSKELFAPNTVIGNGNRTITLQWS